MYKRLVFRTLEVPFLAGFFVFVTDSFKKNMIQVKEMRFDAELIANAAWRCCQHQLENTNIFCRLRVYIEDLNPEILALQNLGICRLSSY